MIVIVFIVNTRPFTMESIKTEWRMVSVKYVGDTEMSHMEIENEGRGASRFSHRAYILFKQLRLLKIASIIASSSIIAKISSHYSSKPFVRMSESQMLFQKF